MSVAGGNISVAIDSNAIAQACPGTKFGLMLTPAYDPVFRNENLSALKTDAVLSAGL